MASTGPGGAQGSPEWAWPAPTARAPPGKAWSHRSPERRDKMQRSQEPSHRGTSPRTVPKHGPPPALPRTAAPSRGGRGHGRAAPQRDLPSLAPTQAAVGAAARTAWAGSLGRRGHRCGHWLHNKRKRLFTNCPLNLRAVSGTGPAAGPADWRVIHEDCFTCGRRARARLVPHAAGGPCISP